MEMAEEQPQERSVDEDEEEDEEDEASVTSNEMGDVLASCSRRKPYYLSPRYTVANRTTHMDVMCVTSSPVRYIEPALRAERLNAKKGRPAVGGRVVVCKLPYHKPLLSKQQLTLSQTLMEDISRKRISAQLVEERRVFLRTLRENREWKVASETRASLMFQSLVRGHLCRLSDYEPKKVKMELSLTAELVDLARQGGLSALEGLSLTDKKQRRRVSMVVEEEVVICEIAAPVETVVPVNVLDSNAGLLQSRVRGHVARKEMRRQLQLTQAFASAAAKIQSRFRVLSTTTTTDEMRTTKMKFDRENQAATKINSLFRARLQKTQSSIPPSDLA